MLYLKQWKHRVFSFDIQTDSNAHGITLTVKLLTEDWLWKYIYVVASYIYQWPFLLTKMS